MTTWETEEDDEVEQPGKLEYQVKAHVALEDSDKETWGMVKDTEGNFIWETGQGALVGQWSRSPVDGLIHVFLETPIQALVDKATQQFAKYAETRRTQKIEAPGHKTRKARTPKEPEPEPQSENLAKIDSLRALFGKK